MNNFVAIVDYGMGNLNSVKKKLDRLRVESVITNDVEQLQKAQKIILPGVGHFSKAMDNLSKLKLIEPLNKFVLEEKKPILGICLGMQLMTKKSEEGDSNGLGWFDAEIVKFKVADRLKFKVPHMGWNSIEFVKENPLNSEINDQSEFYFVHSYHVKSNDESIVLHKSNYEYEFISALAKNNIYGVQYHPEKSHDAGEQMLRNFINL
ncbi:MAG: imidazole glycerol phosphate synthase subunit HisH [Chitinophagales bacterium]|nr:imidazole glycerol phosphate synthase subunit HisH [Chitinophagales bacterium]